MVLCRPCDWKGTHPSANHSYSQFDLTGGLTRGSHEGRGYTLREKFGYTPAGVCGWSGPARVGWHARRKQQFRINKRMEFLCVKCGHKDEVVGDDTPLCLSCGVHLVKATQSYAGLWMSPEF